MKKISIVIMALLLSLTIAVAASKGDYTFTNVAETDATATARVTISSNFNDADRVTVRLAVKKMPPNPDYLLEGWLVDDDTGYKLSLGAFATASAGRGYHLFKQTMVNFDGYDKLVITQEPVGDIDPNPDTPIFVAELK